MAENRLAATVERLHRAVADGEEWAAEYAPLPSRERKARTPKVKRIREPKPVREPRTPREPKPAAEKVTRERHRMSGAERYARYKAYYVAYRQERAEQYRAYNREYGRTRRIRTDADRAYSRNYRKTHDRRAYQAAWSKLHPETGRRARANYQKRHAPELSARKRLRHYGHRPAPGRICASEWAQLKRQYDYTCLACGRKEPDIELTLDHVVPLVRGGSAGIENAQPLCRSCNSAKKDRVVDYRTQPASATPTLFDLEQV